MKKKLLLSLVAVLVLTGCNNNNNTNTPDDNGGTKTTVKVDKVNPGSKLITCTAVDDSTSAKIDTTVTIEHDNDEILQVVGKEEIQMDNEEAAKYLVELNEGSFGSYKDIEGLTQKSYNEGSKVIVSFTRDYRKYDPTNQSHDFLPEDEFSILTDNSKKASELQAKLEKADFKCK